MKGANFWNLAQGAMQVYNFVEGINATRRAEEAHALHLQREQMEWTSRYEAEKMQREYFENPVASDKLGKGRIGTLKDAEFEGMLDPAGLFLGRMEGRPIFYNGQAHLLNYALTRSGKGTDIVLPNLVHVFNRSIVVNDIKDGENAYASASYRRAQGHRIIHLNPHNLFGVGSYKLNPFRRIIRKAENNESVTEDCLQLCMSIIPPVQGSNKWVSAGAQQILSTWLEWSARYRPDRCTLSDMWRFVFRNFNEEMDAISNCGHEGLEGQADLILGITNSEDQYSAYQSELTEGLWNFRPDSPLAKVTESTNFDPEQMRHEKTTLYLMGKSELLEASQKWVSLTVSSIVNSCAQEAGKIPVLFIIDELANLPYMAVIPKALTLYAGKGVQLWGLCQGRNSLLDKGYSPHTIKNFESQSGILHCWNVKESELMKDLEIWSGNTAVATKGLNVNSGAVASGGFGISEQRRPVLQSEDIASVGDGRQIIRTNGPHLYIAERVHWFDVERWKDKLRDVRQVHFEGAEREQVDDGLPSPLRRLPAPD